ncbi:MAG TPA: SRPBCC family protein [Sphingomicrobium sp.]|jgi:uncharacterized membrane protein|nr:SRPBCC family protein [Sphingomicrobium sp.]
MDDTKVRDDAPPTAAKDIKPARSLSAESVTIRKPASELYSFWRSLEKLPQFMENIEAIEVLDDRRSRWTVKAPAGKTVDWEAVITDDCPGESISWQSVEGSEIENSGKIEFRDAGERGTIVRAVIAYEPPAGIVGKMAAKLFQREPRIQSRRDLRRFKQLMETGEIATNARNPQMQAESQGDEK